MPSIKDSYKDQDISFGQEGQEIVVKAGTRHHSSLVNLMIEDEEVKQAQITGTYIAQLQTSLEKISGLQEDKYVEAFVITKSDEGFDIQAVDDARKVSIKKYLREATKSGD